MPIKRIKQLFKMIFSESDSKKPINHQKYGFVIRKGGVYDYLVMDIPDSYSIDMVEIRQMECIVEFRKLTKKFNKEALKRHVKFLNRRQREHAKKLNSKK